MTAMRRLPSLVATLAILVPIVGACIPGTALRPGATPGEASGSSSEPAAAASATPAGPSGPPSFVPPTPTPQPTFLAYVVKAGDTLTSIARRYRTTARSIAFWNRTQHPSLDPDSPSYQPNRIEVGWVLLLVPDLGLDPEDLPQDLPPELSPTAMPSSAAPSAAG
jgi:nucleoid-associated protein YgaU